MDFTGKTILITGASQGIGRFLASFFAKKGADIIITARNETNLKETAGLVREQTGHDCLVLPSDLCDAASLTRLAESIRRENKHVDILINNAGNVTSKPFLETSLEEIGALIGANVTGCLQISRLITEDMVKRGEGMIINFSSLAGYKSNPTQTVYSASKAGVNGISDALDVDLRSKGIHLMNVAIPSVGVTTPCQPHQIPVQVFAEKLEHAIEHKTTELYFSVVTKWLMRLYRFYPPLSRLR